jgi:hypothetical protein
MPTLVDGIRQHRERLRETLYIGHANWDSLLAKVAQQERTRRVDFYDEQVWTFLVGCAYAMRGPEGTGTLAQILTGSTPPTTTKAWFECLSFPPRSREGNTHLDLALGSIALRNGTQGGIELGRDEPSWVCFVECKWYADIAGTVTGDKHRNQLARVIENAVYFKQGDRFAQEVHVTLVTPEVFQSHPVRARLYQYKFPEYCSADTGAANLMKDLSASPLPLRSGLPRTQDRLRNLHLHWITYETLFEKAPDSELRLPFLEFVGNSNGTQRDQPKEAIG